MTTTSATATTGTAFDYSKLTKVDPATTTGTTPAKKNIDGALSQAQFLKLLTTQMTHQDPSKPMENGDFLAQMAQFGTVSGIQDLQKSFTDFSNSITSGQALQAAGLVGHYVSAPATNGYLEAGKDISGNINLTASTQNLQIKIIDAKGKEVDDIQLGTHAKGDVPFVWDGTGADGVALSPGVYKIEASALIDGKNTVLETNINAKVASVNIGSGMSGLKVNLVGNDGSIDFNKIKQVL